MLWRRTRSHSDFSSELQAHIDHEADRLRAEGLSEDEAYARAPENVRQCNAVRRVVLQMGVDDLLV